MKQGLRLFFRAKIQKIEKHKNGKDWQTLLTDLTKDNEVAVADHLWVDLPQLVDPAGIKIGAIVSFEAMLKEFRPRSYYDYRERETVQLSPVCKLTELSCLVIE